MRAREAMIPNPLTVAPTTTLLEFILAVLAGNQTTAAVVDGGQLVGMISVEDVFRRLMPPYIDLAGTTSLAEILHDTYFDEVFEKFKNTTVGGTMSRHLDSIAPDDPLMHAVALFVQKRRKTLPVLDRGKFIGSVTRRSVLAAATKKAQG